MPASPACPLVHCARPLRMLLLVPFTKKNLSMISVRMTSAERARPYPANQGMVRQNGSQLVGGHVDEIRRRDAWSSTPSPRPTQPRVESDQYVQLQSSQVEFVVCKIESCDLTFHMQLVRSDKSNLHGVFRNPRQSEITCKFLTLTLTLHAEMGICSRTCWQNRATRQRMDPTL